MEKFVEAGRKRGVVFSTDPFRVQIVFGKTPEGVAGRSAEEGPTKIITIDSIFWNKFDEERRAFLIFHELGHCVLGRKHTNKRLPKGECKSIMDGKERGFRCSNNFYSENWRQYYLDELFDPATTIPGWYRKEMNFLNASASTKIIFDSSGEAIYEKDQSGYIYPIAIRRDGNFQIDLDSWQIPGPEVNRGILLALEDINFFYDRQSGYINIERRGLQRLENFFYYRKHKAGTKIRLTVRKHEDRLYFFLDKSLIHTMDVDYLHDSSLIHIYGRRSAAITDISLPNIRHHKHARLSILEY